MHTPTDAEALLEQLPDAVVLIDADARVLWANRAAEEQLGWTLADVEGRPGDELIHPDDVATAMTALVSVQDKDLGSAVELRVRLAGGGYRLVELRGRSALEVPGVAGLVLVLRDITDRRRWEVAAGDSELLQSIIDNAPAITMLLTDDGVIRGSSRAMTRLLGRDLEFTIGRALAELAVDADRHLVESEVALAVNLGGRRAFEARFATVSGRSPVPMSVTIVNLLDDHSVGGLVATATDITPLAEARAELHRLATHDVLTGLPNRALLRDRLEHALEGAKRRSSHVSVVYADVDRFKDINDRHGHGCGDEVLVEIARRLASITRASDTVSRVGGDEFVIVVEDDDGAAVQRLLARVEEVMRAPVTVNGLELDVRLSAGFASRAGASAGIDELLARADAEMYRVKSTRQR